MYTKRVDSNRKNCDDRLNGFFLYSIRVCWIESKRQRTTSMCGDCGPLNRNLVPAPCGFVAVGLPFVLVSMWREISFPRDKHHHHD